MSDWIPAIVIIVIVFLWSPLAAAIALRMGMTNDNQHLVVAARLEGIRLGLSAAAKVVANIDFCAEAILDLDPEDIIKENKND